MADYSAIDVYYGMGGHGSSDEYAQVLRCLKDMADWRQANPGKPTIVGELCWEGMYGGNCGPFIQRIQFWGAVLDGQEYPLAEPLPADEQDACEIHRSPLNQDWVLVVQSGPQGGPALRTTGVRQLGSDSPVSGHVWEDELHPASPAGKSQAEQDDTTSHFFSPVSSR